MIGWELPPFNSGGLGVACYGLAKALAGRGTDILFTLPHEAAVSAPFMRVWFAGSEVSRAAAKFTAYSSVGPRGTRARGMEQGGNTLFDTVYAYARAVRERAMREHFDLIHAHDWLTFPAGLAAAEATGKPLITHVHATEFDRTGGRGANSEVYRIEREAFEGAERVATVSNYTRELVARNYSVDPDKISVLHNGIDPEEFKAGQGRIEALRRLRERGAKIVLFVGRLTIQKGPDYFIAAAARTLAHRPNTYFVIAGSGDMERQIIEEAAYRRIAERVLFTGFVRGDERDALYRAADVYVMPSVSEPFGITALEAIGYGVPAIVSKQSGVREVSPHMLLADFWDVDELANKIIAVIDHPALTDTLREHSIKDVLRATWDRTAEKCLEMYRGLLAGQAYAAGCA
ncbi:MAG: glycosyltransferase family 4 protein [bacterium]|nr:glycosyltransferase family 4 protein [bacterium]